MSDSSRAVYASTKKEISIGFNVDSIVLGKHVTVVNSGSRVDYGEGEYEVKLWDHTTVTIAPPTPETTLITLLITSRKSKHKSTTITFKPRAPPSTVVSAKQPHPIKYEFMYQSIARAVRTLYSSSNTSSQRESHNNNEIAGGGESLLLMCHTHVRSSGWGRLARQFPTCDATPRTIRTPPPSPNSTRIAICLYGYVRTMIHTNLSLYRNLILPNERMRSTIDMYASTWDVLGRARKGVINPKHDKTNIPPETITQMFVDSYGAHRVKRVHVMLQAGMQDTFEDLYWFQGMTSPGLQLQISQCAKLIADSQVKYDAVVITRPDVMLESKMVFTNKGPSVYLEKDNAGCVYGQPPRTYFNPEPLLPETIYTDHYDAGFIFGQFSTGDRMFYGVPGAMLKLQDLWAYVVGKYVRGGGGVVNAAFMTHVGLWVRPQYLRLPIIGVNVKCVRGKCQELVVRRK
eukprot:PhF_6_TR26380/c1_g1_i1/m.38053